MNTAHDLPLLITSDNSSSERRVTPSWTIAHFKDRLEPITGVPASCQRLSIKLPGGGKQAIEALDEENTQLVNWPLQEYSEIFVGHSNRGGYVFETTYIKVLNVVGE